MADKLAKKAVREHRVDRCDVDEWIKHCGDAKAVAMWTARATHLANNCDEFPYKDSAASRSKAEAASHKRAIEKLAKLNLPKDNKTADGPKQQGGHVVVREAMWGGERRRRRWLRGL